VSTLVYTHNGRIVLNTVSCRLPLEVYTVCFDKNSKNNEAKKFNFQSKAARPMARPHRRIIWLTLKFILFYLKLQYKPKWREDILACCPTPLSHLPAPSTTPLPLHQAPPSHNAHHATPCQLTGADTHAWRHVLADDAVVRTGWSRWAYIQSDVWMSRTSVLF